MQVSPHIHALKIPFQIQVDRDTAVARFVFVYLICGEKVWLIDSGVAGTEHAVFDYLKRIGRRPEEIAAIIQTHAHPDHIGATRAIAAAGGCAVWAHERAKAWIEDPELQRRARPVPGFRRLVGGPAVVDRLLAQGDRIDLGGGLLLEVLHTPGHSPDSLSFFLPAEGALFCGDAVPVPDRPPVYADYEASVASVKKLLNLAGLELLLSAWDKPRRGPAAKRSLEESLRYLERIHEAVRAAVQDPAAAKPAEITPRVLAVLGLPAAMADPLVERSIAASLGALEALS